MSTNTLKVRFYSKSEYLVYPANYPREYADAEKLKNADFKNFCKTRLFKL